MGRTSIGTTGTDEVVAVETLVVTVGVVVIVFSGDDERRGESKIFIVSLAATAVVVAVVDVVTFVFDAKQGVFITSRRMFGIGVDFVDDATEVLSTSGAVGSAVLTAADVDPPLATSSMTSSMCERVAVMPVAAAIVVVADVVVVAVVVVTAVGTAGDDTDSSPGVDGLSPMRLDDETMFDTRVIKSVCCVTGVETLVDAGVGRLC